MFPPGLLTPKGLAKPAPDNNLPDMLWFDTCIHPDNVIDAKDHMPEYEYNVTGMKRVKKRDRIQLGTPVVVNEKAIALFRHGKRLFAIQQMCPHAGGNLALGDIEEIDRMLCISCPRHKWPFVLLSGDCLVTEDIRAEQYPVEVRKSNGLLSIFVGFTGLNQTLFYQDDF
ncbi:hypothetical protein SDRG_11876 [Saprolegnia diclina VS20]|uniref:Rieske domain-containing protein n=1 Tax=Saprolegnia diclina (strain VS20) TaxID=1156394 RepID=T0PXM6_SAPDV|nr:hypothetical protein SDRG_11876 [Saprolegnia diclina VS20]EQC30299.1 hypothetical protein SDRG_11876 [Saprolegnia diclina VS20]|eukprot:XP_008616152.1 hypothetical protein SDRG_11876 [Saprolegnia diclina VS20]